MIKYEKYLQTHQSRFVNELLDFLRIPSVSALSEHAADIHQTANWVVKRMKAAGIVDVYCLTTGGAPVVYGEWLHAPGKPTILIYGHYDVQPVDPVELWTNPPFAPVVRHDKVYARGASDDKGNMLIPIIAVEAMLAKGENLPVNLKFFFEGEEEIGSPHLMEFMQKHSQKFACDLVISADGVQWGEDQPGLLIGFKGLCALQIDVFGPETDLHSGIYGGTIQNPIHALASILNSLRNPSGQIAVEGFYDDVASLNETERNQMKIIPYDKSDYTAKLGVTELFGEPGYTTWERAWVRPTLEVNGIWGGFQEEGVKTVIPKEAHAKITCRLVPNQDPHDITKRIINHVEAHTPIGVKATVLSESSVASAYTIPQDHPGNQIAYETLEALYGKPPYYTRLGGTLPICNIFLDTLGVYTVTFAFGLEDEKPHAPDEFFRLRSFRRGQLAYCKLLERLGQQANLDNDLE